MSRGYVYTMSCGHVLSFPPLANSDIRCFHGRQDPVVVPGPDPVAVQLSREEWDLVHDALRPSRSSLDSADPRYERLENIQYVIRCVLGDFL